VGAGSAAGPPPLRGLLEDLDPGRRRQALTHRSWARTRGESFERLELLGDAALHVVVTADLMRRHPEASEGDLAWMRQHVVDEASCARVARDSGLPALMVQAAPRAADAAAAIAERPSVQAALAESVIGAAWLDLPRDRVERAVRDAFAVALAEAVPGRRDAKTTLQELLQRDGRRVRYELVRTSGPPHARTFRSRVTVDGRPLSEGEGTSKQASEQQAAAGALAVLGGRQTAGESSSPER
jgi:ribonuclease III